MGPQEKSQEIFAAVYTKDNIGQIKRSKKS